MAAKGTKNIRVLRIGTPMLYLSPKINGIISAKKAIPRLAGNDHAITTPNDLKIAFLKRFGSPEIRDNAG